MRRFELALLITLLAAAAAPAQPTLRDTTRPNVPGGPRASRAVGFYDTRLQRVVIVGGDTQLKAGQRDGVWSWTGTRWELVTDAGPTSRGNPGAAYDARRRVAIVTGGMARAANDSSYEVIADTWEGRPTGWQRITGTDIAPRDHQSLVSDESRGTVLMFGGILGDRSTPWPSDTWELRPDGWARIATDGPPGRGRTAMAYDGRRRHVVLFGGVGGAPDGQPQSWFNDTWVWDQKGWRKVAEGGPRARYAHGMVFDERAGVVLLYSGAAAHRDAPLSDMWQWDGERWTEIRLTGPTPGHRYQPVMVYDRARGRTVLYGGAADSRDDTWEWDGRQWTQVHP